MTDQAYKTHNFNGLSNEVLPCGVHVQSYNTPPLDKIVQQSHFYRQVDFSATYGGHFPSDPYRPASYQQNYTGLPYFQTWNDLEFTPSYRTLLQGNNVNATASLLESRNLPLQYSSAPIALADYAVRQQMVYVGSDF